MRPRESVQIAGKAASSNLATSTARHAARATAACSSRALVAIALAHLVGPWIHANPQVWLAAHAQPVTIGASLALTGDFRVNAIPTRRGWELFQQAVDEAGGMLMQPRDPSLITNVRRPLAMVIKDDNSTVTGAALAYANMSAAGIHLFMGPYSTEITIGALNALEQPPASPFVLVSGTASVTNVFVPHPGAYGILQATGIRLIPSLVRLRSLGARTVMLGSADLAFAQDACSANASALGYTVVGSPNPIVFATAADVQNFAARIIQYRPDVVAVCGLFPNVREVLEKARTMGASARAWLAVGIFDDVRFRNDDVVPGSYTIVASPWTTSTELPSPWEEATNTPHITLTDGRQASDRTCALLSPFGCMTVARLNQMYQQRYGTAIVQDTVSTFAALEVIAQSVAAAGTNDATAVRAQLSARYFDTSFGQVRFGLASRQNTADFVLRQALPAGVAVVGPAEAATTALIYPAPTWQQQACDAAHHCGAHGTCQADGSCACAWGYGGSACHLAFGVPVLVVVAALFVLLVGVLAAWIQRRVHVRRARLQQLERDRQQARVEAASQMAHERTMAYAAHELANPLLTIAATLEEGEAGRMRPTSAFRRVRGALHRLERVVQDMSAAVRGEVDWVSLPMERRRVRLSDIFRDVRHRLQTVHGLTITIRQPWDAPAFVYVDSLRVYQLLVHSLALLREAAPNCPGAELRVTIRNRSTSEVLPHRPLGQRRSVAEPSDPSDVVVAVPPVAGAASQPAVNGELHRRGPRVALFTAGQVFGQPKRVPPRATSTETAPLPAPSLLASNTHDLPDSPPSHRAPLSDQPTVPGSSWCTFMFTGTLMHEIPSVSAAPIVAEGGPLPTRPLRPMASTATTEDSGRQFQHGARAESVDGDGAGPTTGLAPASRPGLAVSTRAPDGHTSETHRLRFAATLGPVTCQRLAAALHGSLRLDLNDREPHFALSFPMLALPGSPTAHGGDDDDQEINPEFTDDNATVSEAAGTSPLTGLHTSNGDTSPASTVPSADPAAHRSSVTHANSLTDLTAGEPRSVMAPFSATDDSTAAAERESSCRVLIVEDEETNARLVAKMAQRAGWHTTVVYDGVDIPFLNGSMPQGSHADYDCILLDIVMRHSNGVAVAREILSLGFRGQIVAMTSNTGAADLERYSEAGFHAVLGKPFTSNDVCSILANAAVHSGKRPPVPSTPSRTVPANRRSPPRPHARELSHPRVIDLPQASP